VSSLGRSGLGLTPNNGTIESNVEFKIGTLTHFNFPIYYAATGATLTLSIEVPGAGGFMADFPVRFLIDETTNVPEACPYPSGSNPCSDKVSWSLPEPRAISIGGNVYALNIKGFQPAGSPTTADHFISQEGSSNTADLYVELVDAAAQTFARDDAYTFTTGQPLSVAAAGVLGNDVGVVAASVAVEPSNGTLALASDGAFVYTPAPGFHGNDSFVYFGTRSNGELSLAVVTLTAVDEVAPVITVPAHVRTEATGPAGAVVEYPAATALDEVDGAVGVVCAPASGSAFPLGETAVECTAEDAAGNAASASFTVTVEDTTAPELVLPASLTAEATSASGAVVSWSASASDLVDGAVDVTCSAASGSTFALGATTVECSAADAAGNEDSGSFVVDVVDTTAPTLALPADIASATTDAGGTVVAYSATAEDAVSGTVAVVCVPASGSLFAPGTTEVACVATDAAGNQADGSFSVTVTTADQLFDRLVAGSTGVGPGRALASQAGAAKASFERGSVGATCGQLGAYLSLLQAQTGKSVPAAKAAELQAVVAQLRTLLGC
jgi:hypothetical protein